MHASQASVKTTYNVNNRRRVVSLYSLLKRTRNLPWSALTYDKNENIILITVKHDLHRTINILKIFWEININLWRANSHVILILMKYINIILIWHIRTM